MRKYTTGNTANLSQYRINTAFGVSSSVSLSEALTINDSDYLRAPELGDLPPLGDIPAAQRSAKVASELAKRASLTSDPVRAQKMKTIANVLWDQSLQTYINVFNSRGKV